MYSKITTFVLVAAMAAVLVTSATLAMADDADAERKKRGGNSQNSVQVNNCDSRNCQSASSQIQGKDNKVVIIQNQD
jgi:hypothetical protein